MTTDCLQQRAERVLAGGPATLSKSRSRFPANAPNFLGSGQGCYVWDADGNMYLDTIAGLGPVFLGHCDPDINDAVREQINDGVCFSLPHTKEVELAELLVNHVKACEKVRFCKNGADATQAAVRIARHATGKDHVLCAGYFGHHDWYISTTDKAGGVLPMNTVYNHQFSWHDDDEFGRMCQQYHKNVAAIIVEVPPMPWGTAASYFELQLLAFRDVAAQLKAVFILDEVVTGFRYGVSGLHGQHGVIPDLVCLGKAMANGYPLAAIGGRADLMDHFTDGQVFLSTTNGGDAVSLAAACATVRKAACEKTHDRLHAVGSLLGETLHRLFRERELPAQLHGDFARMVILWHDDPQGRATADQLKTLWLQETLKHGVLFGVPIFPMACMTMADVDVITNAATRACSVISAALKKNKVEAALEGPVIREVFKRE